MVGSWGKGAQPGIIATVKKYIYPKSSYPKFPQGAVVPSWRTIGLASSWDGKATGEPSPWSAAPTLGQPLLCTGNTLLTETALVSPLIDSTIYLDLKQVITASDSFRLQWVPRGKSAAVWLFTRGTQSRPECQEAICKLRPKDERGWPWKERGKGICAQR